MHKAHGYTDDAVTLDVLAARQDLRFYDLPCDRFCGDHRYIVTDRFSRDGVLNVDYIIIVIYTFIPIIPKDIYVFTVIYSGHLSAQDLNGK